MRTLRPHRQKPNETEARWNNPKLPNEHTTSKGTVCQRQPGDLSDIRNLKATGASSLACPPQCVKKKIIFYLWKRRGTHQERL